jgi:PAS domain S-box-containing protein
MTHATVKDILATTSEPMVAIDEQGIITQVNSLFLSAYGWGEKDLVGRVITVIMPPYMRDAHNFGFSRFLMSEQARILNKPLSLPVYCKDGTIVEAEHYIAGEKTSNGWQFAATITRKDKVT